MADLFKAVEFSIGRHAYDTAFRETFPEKAQSFDYSLGPAREMMEEHQVDAVWMVSGYNLLPTVGAQLTDMTEILLALVTSYGGGHAPRILTKVEFRAALVDKNGLILFYYKDWPSAGGVRDPPFARGSESDMRGASDATAGDVRDPRFARALVRELLSNYRKAVAQ
jgi:hypothetical protein